jgi:hypothetical protein
MSDNDDSNRADIEKNALGIQALGICNNLQTDIPNYSVSGFGSTYGRYNSVDWLDVQFTEPNTNKFSVNFQANRYYKFTLHFDYVWTADDNLSHPISSFGGRTGRIEIRVRDVTHRHDLIYWTNYVDADYNMGGVGAISTSNYYIRDTSFNYDGNIWDWNSESFRGGVPSSCHAVRAMGAKTSGQSIIKVQYRPMNCYGGVVPPQLMDCSGSNQPVYHLPIQYKNSTTTYNLEGISQYNAYFSVEDCGQVEKPSGVASGVIDDPSISPLYEAYENHPYNAMEPTRP